MAVRRTHSPVYSPLSPGYHSQDDGTDPDPVCSDQNQLNFPPISPGFTKTELQLQDEHRNLKNQNNNIVYDDPPPLLNLGQLRLSLAEAQVGSPAFGVRSPDFLRDPLESPELMSQKYVDSKFSACIIGDEGVGKSCLAMRLGEGSGSSDRSKSSSRYRIPELHHPTIGVAFQSATVFIRNTFVKLTLGGTGGRFEALTREKYIPFASAVLIVYDVTNRRSFQNVERWVAMVRAKNRNKSLLGGTQGKSFEFWLSLS